jgi:hypothetical protein
MKRIGDVGIVLSMCLMGPTLAVAQQNDLATQRAALKEIREAAADICYTVEQRGQKSEVELTGEVQAKVTGVVAKVADLGVKGSGHIGAQEYQGVSQEALGAALAASANCRERVFNKLVDRILPPQSGMVAPPRQVSPQQSPSQQAPHPEPNLLKAGVLRLTGETVVVNSNHGYWLNAQASVEFGIENRSGADLAVGFVSGTASVGPCGGTEVGTPSLPFLYFARVQEAAQDMKGSRGRSPYAELLRLMPAGSRVSGSFTVLLGSCAEALSGKTTVAASLVVLQ